jgi:hypothetical protein
VRSNLQNLGDCSVGDGRFLKFAVGRRFPGKDCRVRIEAPKLRFLLKMVAGFGRRRTGGVFLCRKESKFLHYAVAGAPSFGRNDKLGNARRWRSDRCRFLQFAAEHGDYVVGGDDAHEFVVLVNHGQGHEVVLVKEFGDFVVASSFVSEDERLLQQREQRG